MGERLKGPEQLEEISMEGVPGQARRGFSLDSALVSESTCLGVYIETL
jgi:hypothetical protein